MRVEIREGKPAPAAKKAAVARTATKAHPTRKSLSDFITERFDDFSRSQKDVARYIVDHLDEAAFQTAEELARRANTSSSTVVRFSQALGFDGYPELQQAAIEEYRHKVAEGAPNGNGGGGAAALFNFDHSEFEASLGADYANIEETARSLTREQIEASVSALATARRVLIVGVEQMAFFASYLRHLLGLLDVRAEIVASPSQDNIQKLSRMDEETLLVVLTAGRAHPLILRALKLARHRRARTMSITDATLSDVAEHSELMLYYSSNGPSYIRSNAALMGLVQALAHGVYSRDEAAHRDRIRAFKLK
jgi:DNA-binding MurR/RpiR family transcriptional regulator